MSEYWVSKNRFYCTYCKVYIADDKPSRLHHESGGRHKGNLERYIRDIYKKGAQKEKSKAEEDREMKVINAAAAAAMGQTPEASTSKPPPAAVKKSAPAPKSSNPFSNYSSAESLGYLDPDAVQASIEKAERQTEGKAGEWSYITSTAKGKAAVKAEDEELTEEEQREAERQERRAQDDPDRKTLKFSYLKEKTLPNMDDDDGYGNIAIKVRAPKVTKTVDENADSLAKARAQAEQLAPPGSKPGSSSNNGKMKFKAIVPREQEENEETQEQIEARNQAAWDLIAPKEEDDEKKPDVTAPSMFKKKRKAGANGTGTDAGSSSKRRIAE